MKIDFENKILPSFTIHNPINSFHLLHVFFWSMICFIKSFGHQKPNQNNHFLLTFFKSCNLKKGGSLAELRFDFQKSKQRNWSFAIWLLVCNKKRNIATHQTSNFTNQLIVVHRIKSFMILYDLSEFFCVQMDP